MAKLEGMPSPDASVRVLLDKLDCGLSMVSLIAFYYSTLRLFLLSTFLKRVVGRGLLCRPRQRPIAGITLTTKHIHKSLSCLFPIPKLSPIVTKLSRSPCTSKYMVNLPATLSQI